MTTGEDIQRIAVSIQVAPGRSLRMTAIVHRVGDAQLLTGQEVPDQVAVDAIALRVGVVGGVQAHGVEDVAVTVDVETRQSRVTDDAAIGVVGHRRFGDQCRATTVSQRVLHRRVDRQQQIVSQVPQRIDADVASVRRIDTHTVIVAAGRRVQRIVRAGQQRGRCNGRCAIVVGHTLGRGRAGAGGQVVIATTELGEAGFAGRAVLGIAVAVAMHRQRDEVAVAEVLTDLTVDLQLFQATRTTELVVLGGRSRDEGRGAERAHSAGIKAAEGTTIRELTGRQHGQAAHLCIRLAGAPGDRATGGRGRGAVDVGGTQVHINAVDDLAVRQLVRVRGIVTRIVDRNAIKSQ